MLENTANSPTLLDHYILHSPLIISPKTSLLDAITQMSQVHSSYILIAEQEKLLGILTERDIVKITVGELDLQKLTVSEVMTTNVVTITRLEMGDIFSVLALLRASKIRHLPVLDEQEKVMGIITPDSMRQSLKATDLLKMRRIEEIIVSEVITASPEVSLWEIAEKMTISRKSCIVISENSPPIPLGIITERDIVKFKLSGLNPKKTLAGSVMSSPILPGRLGMTLWEAHLFMESHKIRRLVIVNPQGHLAGIITQTTLLQALDPIEIYTTVKLLQQRIDEKTQELTQINSRIQAEVIERQEMEKQLLKMNKILEEKVKERTRKLSHVNQKLCQQNQELQETVESLKKTQKELIYHEKMAALGQLIAGITHEINNPLGVIQAGAYNLHKFFEETFLKLPNFFRELTPEKESKWLSLLSISSQNNCLSSREKRQIKKRLTQQLGEKKIANSEEIADLLVDISGNELPPDWLSLLDDEQFEDRLEIIYEIATFYQSSKSISEAIRRATKIVTALKKYSHSSSSEEKVVTSVSEGIETVLTLYQNQFKQGIELSKNYDFNLPPILGYPDELNQVWTNLIYNALQAMNYEGQLEINVSLENQCIQVSIIDSGKGIPSDILPRIFDPFFTTKPSGEGSGLGLDIVRKIVDKHQGTIQVNSRVGRTTFTVSLPILM